MKKRRKAGKRKEAKEKTEKRTEHMRRPENQRVSVSLSCFRSHRSFVDRQAVVGNEKVSETSMALEWPRYCRATENRRMPTWVQFKSGTPSDYLSTFAFLQSSLLSLLLLLCLEFCLILSYANCVVIFDNFLYINILFNNANYIYLQYHFYIFPYTSNDARFLASK